MMHVVTLIKELIMIINLNSLQSACIGGRGSMLSTLLHTKRAVLARDNRSVWHPRDRGCECIRSSNKLSPQHTRPSLLDEYNFFFKQSGYN